jgi:hypothetical protein
MNFRLGDFFKKQKSYNHNREGYKSSEKKNEEKTKNIEDIREKTINLQYNINEIFGNKKYNEQIKPFLQNNGNLYEAKNISNNISNNNSINKIMKKKLKSKHYNLNAYNSPDKIIIKINNVGNYNTLTKNKILQKKIMKNNTNTNALNSNDNEPKKSKIYNNKKKYNLHHNTDNSPNNKKRKSSKISSKKNYMINIKNKNNNSSKNSSNSKNKNKNNNSNNQITNTKGIKVESINIDLNIVNKKNNYNSQKKKQSKDISLNDLKILTLRQTEFPKKSKKLNHLQMRMELNLNHHILQF